MKKMIRNGLGAAALAVTAIATSHAAGMGGGQGGMGGHPGMMGNSAQLQQMMDQRSHMMKSTLKLTPAQETKFNKFADLQKNAMNKMMQRHQQMMQGGGGRQGLRSQVATMSFDQRMTVLKENAESMLSISKAGMDFYNSLSAEQKKTMNDMPKQMQGMHQPGMPQSRSQ
jgi:Spy/CpxP family protein refolding chaperone